MLDKNKKMCSDYQSDYSVKTAKRKKEGAMLKILIVDDEEHVRVPLSRYLESKGMAVLQASNLKEAIEVLDAAQSEIQVIVTDNDMENQGDGLLLLKEVQQRGLLIPVMLASGRIIESDREKLRQEGFMEVFCKPAKREDILQAIKACR